MTQNLPYLDKPSIWSSHSMIAARLHTLPDQSRVLDVGTATGTLARMCSDKKLHFFGVEPNVEWAEVASPMYKKIFVGSIDDIADEYLIGYDAIVLADILEHLSAPETVLQKLVGLQSPNSIFIISVPNVANLWVRLNLLFGRFEYADRGICDRMHLRFFTRRTLIAMVKNAGLEIQSIRTTPIPLELVSNFFVIFPGSLLHSLLARCTSWLPTLLGYQFIVEAKKHERNR